MHPYRRAAPPEPDPPDQVDVYEAFLRARAARARRVATVVSGAIAGLSLLALTETPPPSRAPAAGMPDMRAARIATARQAIAAAARQAADEQGQFADAIAAASDLPDSPSGSLCGLAMPEATHLVHGKQSFPLLVVARGDRHFQSPSIVSFLTDIRRAEEYLDSGRFAEGMLYASTLDARTRLRYEVVLVTSYVKPPVRASASSFERGEIAGRAYVYDFREHRITCAGDVRASNSRYVEYTYVPGYFVPAALDPNANPYGQGPSLTASLDVDLESQIRRTIAGGALFAIDSADR